MANIFLPIASNYLYVMFFCLLFYFVLYFFLYAEKNVCLFNEFNAFCGWETSIERAQKICFPKNFENCFCRKIFLTLHYFFLQFPMTMAWRRCVNSETSGQSYKHFMLVNYDSRVVIWGIFQSGTTLES